MTETERGNTANGKAHEGGWDIAALVQMVWHMLTTTPLVWFRSESITLHVRRINQEKSKRCCHRYIILNISYQRTFEAFERKVDFG